MAGRGRRTKPYKTADGTDVPGLIRKKDGRWEIRKLGIRFTEPDEQKAVACFYEFTRKTPPVEHVRVEAQPNGNHGPLLSALVKVAEAVGPDSPTVAPIVEWSGEGNDRQVKIGYDLDPAIVWPWVRQQLADNVNHVGQMIGVCDLAARLRNDPIPAGSIRLSAIRKHYEVENPSTELSKDAALRTWKRFVDHTEARTLADLTKERIHRFRQSIETDPAIKSGGTKQHLYGQVKSILAFALKHPMLDSAEIRATLDRCKLLWTPTPTPAMQPKPISRENFHKLLTAADPNWRAWLLMGLNCAMYLKELINLEWSHVDLQAGTLAMIRNKTKRERIPRAATLWPETIAALRALPRKPTYVFTSPHGTRYASSQARANAFADLRIRAAVSDDVSFSHLRDGAYTVACRVRGIDTRLPKVLAGHSCGMEDSYVLRDPAMVRPACDAVYAYYGPF